MADYNRKPQAPNPFVVFDFETGGLDSRKNAATEIALLSIKGDASLEEICRYQDLIKPYDKSLEYTQRALDVSNIQIELLEEEGKDIFNVVDNIVEFFRQTNLSNAKNSAGLRPVLVGHNAMFDIGFLHHIFEYRFRDVKKTSGQDQLESLLHGRRDFWGNFQPSYLDTWSLGKMWFGADEELLDFKLGTLVERAGVELSDAHRAMNDVVATGEFLKTVMRSLRSGFGVGEGSSSHRDKRQGFQFPI